MLQILHYLKEFEKQVICIGVHAVFANNAYETLLAANPAQVITCNSIQHPSNGIDLNPLFIKALL